MKVLVTGANGFLGHWMVHRLVKEGYEVSVLVRKNSDLSGIQNLKINYIYGDVTNVESLYSAFKNQNQVFHLAGVIAYKASERQLMESVNVDGTRNVVEACEASGVQKLIHLSSVVAIGASNSPKNILNENSTYNLQELNLGYFETKRKAEEIVVNATKSNRIQSVILNPSTIYGFGDAKKGSRKMQIKVARGQLPIYTSGGVNVVAVEDVVEGILIASRIGANGQRYILSSENLTIKQLFEQIAIFARVNPPKYLLPNWLVFGMGYTGEFMQSLGLPNKFSLENAHTSTLFHWFDNHKAVAELNFKPKPSAYAIENSVRWMKDNGYLG